jgi:hypothetical protein
MTNKHEIRKRKANWIGHILRRNCPLQRVTEGKIQGGIEVTGRQGRRRRKLLDDLKESRGYSHLKEEALDRTMWKARFGRGFGPVVRQTAKWMNGKQQRTVFTRTQKTQLHLSPVYFNCNTKVTVNKPIRVWLLSCFTNAKVKAVPVEGCRHC